MQEAVGLDVPAPVITLSLLERFRSRQAESYAAKVIAALRHEFGGHPVEGRMTRPSVAVPLRLSEVMQAPPEPFKIGDPCTAVILGAGGDLTQRKLMPALFHLLHDGLLHDDFSVVGAAREQLSDAEFRLCMRQAVATSTEVSQVPDEKWDRFARANLLRPGRP